MCNVRVLFDAFYLCPQVTRACESRGYSYFSVAAKGRNFRPLEPWIVWGFHFDFLKQAMFNTKPKIL